MRTFSVIVAFAAAMTLAIWAVIQGSGLWFSREEPASIEYYRHTMTLRGPDGTEIETYKLFGEYTKREKGGGFFDDFDNGILIKSNAEGEIRYYTAVKH